MERFFRGLYITVAILFITYAIVAFDQLVNADYYRSLEELGVQMSLLIKLSREIISLDPVVTLLIWLLAIVSGVIAYLTPDL